MAPPSPTPRSLAASLIALVVLLAVLTPAWATQAEPSEDPLIERARELREAFGQSRDPGETEVYRAQLLAVADSLETAEELVWATQLLERAGILSYLATEHEQARRTWERGLRLARAANDSSRIGALLNAKAIGVSATGDRAQALRLLAELVAFRRAAGDLRGEGVSLTNLALEQIGLFYMPEAMRSLREAIEAHREVGNDAGLSVAARLLTTVHAVGGRPDEAVRWADLAVVHAEKVGEPPILVPALLTRGQQYLDLGRIAEADRDLERGLELAVRNDLERIRPLLLTTLSELRLEQGRPGEVISSLGPVLDAVEREGTLGAGLHARTVLARAVWHDGRRVPAWATLDSLQAEFFALQDTLRDPVQRAQANQQASVLSVLPALQIRDGRLPEAWRSIEEGLATELRRTLQPNGKVVELSAWQDSLANLDARALVFGLPGGEGMPAMVVGEELSGFVVDFSAELRRDLDRLQSLLASGAEDARCEPLISRVSEALAGPLSAAARSPAPQRLLIVPGGLSGIALDLLRGPDGRALHEQFAVTYAPSATTFLQLQRRPIHGQGFLAVADPAVPNQGLASTPDTTSASDPTARRAAVLRTVALPQARQEARRIAPPGATILVGEKATVSAVLAEAVGKRVLHFAVHASVDPWLPRNSALVLASSPTDSQPTAAVLEADELEHARLECDLVSLSGCSTAGGYRVLGEGTFGLHRAFLVGGARSVVASQWQVEDRAARRFMELFYAAMSRGEARDQAVRHARRTMAQEGFPYRDRAAFVLFGAVGGAPLALQPGAAAVPSWWPVAASLLVVALALLALRRRFRSAA